MISYEHQHADVYAGKTFCRSCNKHLVYVHKGYGEEKQPLDTEDMEILGSGAEAHDKILGDHDIVVYLFSPTYAK